MVYCMADIHGEIDRFHTMLKQIHLTAEDTLYIIGDVIDRHPCGLELLREIMCCPNMIMLLGNHEQMLLDTFSTNNRIGAKQLWKQNGGASTYREMTYCMTQNERDEIVAFLQGLPDHLDIEVNDQRFHLVHGVPANDTFHRIWDRPEPPPTEPPIPSATVIVGHTCTYYLNLYCEGYDEDAPWEIFYGPGLIGIDCGCGNESELRRLACLRLDDMQEFYA